MRMHEDSNDSREPAAPTKVGFGGRMNDDLSRDFGFGADRDFEYSVSGGGRGLAFNE
jgi:hypothetical protein